MKLRRDRSIGITLAVADIEIGTMAAAHRMPIVHRFERRMGVDGIRASDELNGHDCDIEQSHTNLVGTYASSIAECNPKRVPEPWLLRERLFISH